MATRQWRRGRGRPRVARKPLEALPEGAAAEGHQSHAGTKEEQDGRSGVGACGRLSGCRSGTRQCQQTAESGAGIRIRPGPDKERSSWDVPCGLGSPSNAEAVRGRGVRATALRSQGGEPASHVRNSGQRGSPIEPRTDGGPEGHREARGDEWTPPTLGLMRFLVRLATNGEAGEEHRISLGNILPAKELRQRPEPGEYLGNRKEALCLAWKPDCGLALDSTTLVQAAL
ncbi:hypothetical protein NDU88_004850 [Pleurodeles waltl]|uniref:Uncharacterized protein n=1 Tax=Pleurodeles waltl TaxID=8319 RepID=A0AAV7UI81_PLEWA|nr:hypothetical protein NDU88_004850 [Pleurodeles waltl]